jgi:hypothetical protein
VTAVALVGNFDAVQSTENAYADAFRRLGCEVSLLTQVEAHALGPAGVGSFAEGADLLVYTRTHNATALPSSFTALWRGLERGGTATASTHLDVFWGIPERERWVRRGDPMFTTGHVFTADGGSDERWEQLGVRHSWLAPAADQRFLRRGHAWRKYRCDVLFLGTAGGYHREWPWRERLVAGLRARYGERFVHVGRGGPLGVVATRRCPDVVASARVVVGDSIFAGRPRYWSNRVPEQCGAGGAMVHPACEGLAEAHPYVVQVPPQDLEAVIGAVDELLGRDDLDRRRDEGRADVAARHTFVQRAADVLRVSGIRHPDEIFRGSRAGLPGVDRSAAGAT